MIIEPCSGGARGPPHRREWRESSEDSQRKVHFASPRLIGAFGGPPKAAREPRAPPIAGRGLNHRISLAKSNRCALLFPCEQGVAKTADPWVDRLGKRFGC